MKNEAIEAAKASAPDPNDLAAWDVITINTSAGKDSLAMLIEMTRLAIAQGAFHKLHVVHCAFPEEWAGTEELARKQATLLGLGDRFYVQTNDTPTGKDGLLARIEKRGQWPARGTQYCTSEFKVGPANKRITKLTRGLRAELGRTVLVLNCMGVRAAESKAREKKPAFVFAAGRSSGVRSVFTFNPIFDWSVERVWSVINASGLPSHPAYALGMPRLSCMFCVFASKDALMIAGQKDPKMLADYVAAEERMGHSFRDGFKIASVKAALDAGETPNLPIKTWET